MADLWSPLDVARWPHGVSYDGLRTLIDKPLGAGRDRVTFACPWDPTVVVKAEPGRGPERQNVAEWRLWQVVDEAVRTNSGDPLRRFREIRRWLAPALYLSDGGTFLVMRRTTPAPLDAFPKRVPSFLFDMKRENFGMLEGRLVCHDYGIIAGVLMNNALCGRGPRPPERRADWWNE